MPRDEMSDAPSIAEIIVTLDDGRWQTFSAADLSVIREFAGLTKQWRLLEFITQLTPPVRDSEIPQEVPDAIR